MKNVRLIREDKGLTLFQVAKVVDIEPSRLSKFETGRFRELHYQDMKRLAAFYSSQLGREVTIDELLEETPPVESLQAALPLVKGEEGV